MKHHIITTSDGVRLAAKQLSNNKNKDTVLMIHGLTSSSEYFDCLQEWLYKMGYNSIGYDMRGHGDSHKDNTLDYSPIRLLQDAIEVAEAYKLNNPILLGVSLGSITALAWACGYMENTPPLSRLILVSCTSDPFNNKIGLSEQALKSIMLGDMSAFGMLSLNDTCPKDKKYISLVQKLDYVASKTNMNAVSLMLKNGNINLSPYLSNIKIPTLIVHGSMDGIFPITSALYLSQHIQNAQLAVDPNRGHSLLVTDPDFVYKVIDNFFGAECKICV